MPKKISKTAFLKSLKINISPGNIKTGPIPAVSLPPFKTCLPGLPCYEKCYAGKAWKQYPAVRKAWTKNLDIYLQDPGLYFNNIYDYIRFFNPDLFRFHVAGDIVDKQYLASMLDLTISLPGTNFLAFTKKYHLVNHALKTGSVIPDNLSIVFSVWPGLDFINPHHLPLAYCQDGTENRIDNAIQCHGSCETCGMCWHLENLGINVFFKLH